MIESRKNGRKKGGFWYQDRAEEFRLAHNLLKVGNGKIHSGIGRGPKDIPGRFLG